MYRRKPLIIEAIQFQMSPNNFAEVQNFIGEKYLTLDFTKPLEPNLIIKVNKDITYTVKIGDYIIKEIDGSGFYAAKKDTFEKVYEQIEPNIIEEGEA